MIVISDIKQLFQMPEVKWLGDGWKRISPHKFSFLFLGNWVDELDALILLCNDIKDIDLTFLCGPKEMDVLYKSDGKKRRQLIQFIRKRGIHLIYIRFNYIFSYGTVSTKFCDQFEAKDSLYRRINQLFILSIKKPYFRDLFTSSFGPLKNMDGIELHEQWRLKERDTLTELFFPSDHDTQIHTIFVQHYAKNNVLGESKFFTVKSYMPLYNDNVIKKSYTRVSKK